MYSEHERLSRMIVWKDSVIKSERERKLMGDSFRFVIFFYNVNVQFDI